MDCHFEVEWGEFHPYHGKLRTQSINQEKLDYVKKHNLHLDCIANITVKENWKVRNFE